MSSGTPGSVTRYAVVGTGLWRRRDDLSKLFPQARFVPSPLAFASKPDAVVGWGNKPSGVKARRFAGARDVPALILEDGFLHGYFPGQREPQASYSIDRSGIYYDSSHPSDLEALIEAGTTNASLLSRARLAMDELSERQVSKYNNAPLINLKTLGVDPKRGFVLLIDQVWGDASIAGAQADSTVFKEMLDDAIAEWPEHQIIVRPHLASTRTGHLEEAAKGSNRAVILDQICNIWPLLKAADRVYTVSSQAGFEAIFCGTPVTCYGYPFYAGWGLTDDRLPASLVPRRTRKRSLEEVFASAYIDYSRYLDLHDRNETTLENSIDALTTIRDSRARNQHTVFTAGLSPWKRKAVQPFLIGQAGNPVHCTDVQAAIAAAANVENGVVAVWGADHDLQSSDSLTTFKLEDGFLRSVGLGSSLRFPMSLVRDEASHLYFDARGKGTIEHLLSTRPFDTTLLSRAERLIETIVYLKLTKYLLGDGRPVALPESFQAKEGRLKILVTGQVENDASIRYGAPEIKTNTNLLNATRESFPDALIAYREHPDVAGNLRPGKADRSAADLDADAYPLPSLLEWCDRVETITSLTGFEALLRGMTVGVQGWPFYAGWGLTDDRLSTPPRGSVTLPELVAATLILYPDYIHPMSRLPCSVERAVDALSNPPKPKIFAKLLWHPLGHLTGLLKHRLQP